MDFFATLGQGLSRVYGFFAEFFSILRTSIELPLELVGVLPDLLGTAVLVVVCIMIVKLILGR